MPTVKTGVRFAAVVNDEEPCWRKDALKLATIGKVCRICLGMGWVREDVPRGHELFGQVFRCTCWKEKAL
jgi:hypothetical protein